MNTATITAGEVMTGFVAAEPSDTLDETAALMLMVEQGCHHLPVVDTDARPIGVVGMRSVVSETIERLGVAGEVSGWAP